MQSTLTYLLAAAAVTAAQPQPAPSSFVETRPSAMLEQILPKLRRTLADPYSVRDFSLCPPCGLKLKKGRPDRWTVFFSFNAKNSLAGYTGIRTWLAAFRGGRLQGEPFDAGVDDTSGLMVVLNRPSQRQLATCAPVPDEEIQRLMISQGVAR